MNDVELPPHAPEVSDAPASKRLRTGRVKGIALVKPEYKAVPTETAEDHVDSAAADQFAEEAGRAEEPGKKPGKREKKRGQNKGRDNSQKHEAVRLCLRPTDAATGKCDLGEKCKFEHDTSVYLASKPADISGECPVFQAIGYCPSGVKCRWLGSHAALEKQDIAKPKPGSVEDPTELNRLEFDTIGKLQKRQVDMADADAVIKKMDELDDARRAEAKSDLTLQERLEYNAAFFEGRLGPLEKKRIDYRNAKILSPLTTVGNLPYRRLMKQLGADVTYSEMALSMPLVQGQRSEWALPRMHVSEQSAFGVQIAATKPWQATKAARVLAEFAPHATELNLNCGCPIDLVFRQGAGSALMDAPGRIMRIIKGMNAESGDKPVTIKLRTGTKDNKPTAHSLVSKLIEEQQVAAITLHGRSRAQRYAREADWEYIREVADLVKEKRDEYDLKPWVIGNGDVFSWQDWYTHVEDHHVDACMVARGALVKPWIFEEIEAKQYLDKSASERLELYRQYSKFGLEHWGSDDFGVQQTRRFLCEFLSFTRRYVPVGVLEYLPPHLNDRAEPYSPRSDLEGLLASGNHKDWIKITEMFLGPAPESFQFEPKHKSAS